MPDVSVFRTSDAEPGVLANIRRLLDVAFDGDFSDDDWDHTVGGWHVVVRDAGVLVAHAAVVARDLWVGGARSACGYVEGVGTLPGRQGEGLGSMAMNETNAVVQEHFHIGALSTDRHAFYARLGWERWQGPTFVLTGEARVRTPGEDDGVMVLRFGPSSQVDLAEAIACRDRPGDAW